MTGGDAAGPEMTPWPENDDLSFRNAHRTRGGTGYAALLAAERHFLDAIAAAALPDDESARVTRALDELTAQLVQHAVPERERVDGWRPDLPGRGSALFPPYEIDEEATDGTVRGRVTFPRFFLGGNGAAHGGTQPLLFDDILGRCANYGLPGVARTAYLKVEFRAVTPMDVELRVEATRDSVVGRKRLVSGRLRHPDGTLLCEADALFLELRPGQP